MFDIRSLALQMISQNPRIANNPTAMQMINAIQSNDPKKGEELADSICKTYGLTREQALQQAQQGLFKH